MRIVRGSGLTISLDGFLAGPDQSLEVPLGVGGERLHEWAFATRSMRELHGTVQQYLRAGLIDELHLVLAPVVLGSGERLFADLPSLGELYECVETAAGERAIHFRLKRRS